MGTRPKVFRADKNGINREFQLMTRHVLTIGECGLTTFAVCRRCNCRIESRLLNQIKARNEILDKYEAHKCRQAEDCQKPEKPMVPACTSLASVPSKTRTLDKGTTRTL
jgi:hypothetical protein